MVRNETFLLPILEIWHPSWMCLGVLASKSSRNIYDSQMVYNKTLLYIVLNNPLELRILPYIYNNESCL